MRAEKPKISVVIPVHNRPAEVLRAIRSVREQTVTVQEIIVVDDGSTDETPGVLESQIPGILLLKQENAGAAAARNTGILAAKGEWIAFLDSDDTWLPDKLEKQCTFLRTHPGIRILQTEEIWIRSGKRVNPPNKYLKKGGNIFTECLSHCIISTSTVICRKDLLEESGLFDTTLPVCEDYDLWLRIAAREAIPLLPEALTIKNGGQADQLSVRYTAMDRFRVRSLEKILCAEPLDPAQKKAVRSMLLKKLSYLRDGARRRGIDAGLYEEKISEYSAL
jgi:glycosyltransferase involved in cell wall biosynthesis